MHFLSTLAEGGGVHEVDKNRKLWKFQFLVKIILHFSFKNISISIYSNIGTVYSYEFH